MLEENIFAPLGMTSSRVISDQEIVRHRAAGYERRGGKLYNQEWVSPTFNSTADGTLYLTVRDMERWDRALCSATLVSPTTLAQIGHGVVDLLEARLDSHKAEPLDSGAADRHYRPSIR